MAKRFIIPQTHFPVRAPLWQSVVLYMALDIYNAPGWLWGVMGTIAAILWIIFVMITWQEENKPLPGYGEENTLDKP